MILQNELQSLLVFFCKVNYAAIAKQALHQRGVAMDMNIVAALATIFLCSCGAIARRNGRR